MADTNTTNLNLIKPEIGGAEDTWGVSINSDLDALDAIFSATGTEIDVRFNSANFDDNKKAIFGTGDDLQIYHDATNSHILNATGDLFIKNDANDKDIIFQSDDGSGGLTTYFYVDGSGSRVIFEQHTRHMDNFYAAFGSDADLRLFHNGTDSKIQQSSGATGNLVIEQAIDDKDIILKSDDGSGGVAAYITLDGSTTLTQFDKDTKHVDNVKANFGDSADLQIYHDGSNSFINETGTGNLYIQGAGTIRLRGTTTEENLIEAVENGAVSLYHDNSVKLATTSTGVDVTGVLAVNSGTTDTAATFTSSDTAVAVNFVASDNSMQIATSSTDGIIKNNGAGSFRFFNNGSEAARINSSGLVGIGLTSPSSPLTIKSSATHSGGGLRIIQDSGTNVVASLFGGVNSGTRFGRLELSETSGDAINVRISADPSLTSYINAGNFGIGDTNPSAIRLSVVTPTANHVGLQVENSNTADSFGMIVKGGNDANDYTADFRKRDNTGIMRIRGDGNIGIGTTSPSEKLEVAGNIKVGSGGIVNSDTFNNRANSANIIYRSSSTTIVGNNANALVVADAGNIGIGTSSPQGNLHVEGAAGASGGGIIYVTDADNGSTASDALHISKSGDTAFVYNRESSGDLQLGAGNTAGHVVIKSSGNVGIGTTAPSQKLHVDGIIASQNSAQGTGLLQLQGYGNTAYINHTGSSNLHFRMGSGFTTRMTLTNAGNLGVGTSSPGSLLTVEGDIRQTTGDLLYGGGGNWDIKHLADDQNIVFYTSESGSATEKMRIKANGAVGIGTSSPSASHKLTVGGDTKFTGQLSMSDNQLIKMGDSEDFAFYHDTSIGNVIKSSTSDMDISILGNDGGSSITALKFDMSQAGEADFNSAVKVAGGITAHQTDRGVLEYASNFFKNKIIWCNRRKWFFCYQCWWWRRQC